MAKRNKRVQSGQKKQQQQLMIYGGVVIFLLAVIAFFAYTTLTAPPEVAEARLNQESRLGTAGATVQLIEYGAYGCHSCRAVHQNGILENILERYGDRIEFIFRNAPIISPNDRIAAEAAQCALDQGDEAFWTFHDAIYDLSDSEFNDYSDKENYVGLAQASSLDAQALENCLDNKTHRRTVDHWYDESQQVGINGTPTFFINGRRISGTTHLETAIEDALGL